MTDEQKWGYLKELAKSNQGEALKEHFEEKIAALTDARNYKAEDFEMEGKSSIKAAAILKKIITELNLMKQDKKGKEQNQYI